MAQMPHYITVDASLDFSDHPEEETAWKRLADEVEKLIERAGQDPEYEALHWYIKTGRVDLRVDFHRPGSRP